MRTKQRSSMFVRRATVAAAAVAALAQPGAATPTSSPPPSMVVNPTDQPAFTYSNEPFQCIQPTVSLNVNASHVWILTTSYSQQAADTRTTNGPAGRTQFSFGSFLSGVAYPAAPYWDPAASPAITTANMFSSLSADSYLNMGSCGLGPNAGGSYTQVKQLTVAPTLTGSQNTVAGTSTSGLTGLTSQAFRCTCATYAITTDVNGVPTGVSDLTLQLGMSGTNTYVCPTDGVTDADANHIFYSDSGNTFNGRAGATLSGQLGVTQASKTNSWSYRQTTCGASAGDACGTATTGGAIPFTGAGITGADGSVATCSIKTEALLIMPIEQFIVVMSDNEAVVTTTVAGTTLAGTAGSSSLQYTWEDYVIEYASTAAVGAANGVDIFQTRVTPSRFKMNLYPAGAFVQSLGIGDVAPPMLLHTTATGNTGAVAWTQRVNANTLKMTWQFEAYVQQSNRNSAATDFDTVFKSIGGAAGTGMRVTDDSTNNPILLFGTTGYTATCDPWLATQVEGTDQTTLTVNGAGVITSGYGCAEAGCAPVVQSTLPSDLLSGLTPAAIARAQYWVDYHVTVVCTIVRTDASYAMTDDFVMPSTTIQMKYRLQDANGNELTDMTTPPFSEIIQVGYRSPGTATQSIDFDLQASMIQLLETDIQAATDLTDLIYTSEDNAPLPNQLVYSEAMAVKVQIVDNTVGVALPTDAPVTEIGQIRNAWQLQPTLMLMVAHDTSDENYVSFTSGTIKPTAESPIPTSWCGLNQGSAVVGLWSVQDVRASGSSATGTYLAGFQSSGNTLIKLGPSTQNIVDVLSTGLKSAISSYTTNNVFNSIADLQTDILNGVAGTAFTTAMAADGATYTKVAIVPDATGGFAFPLRNRFFINGKASGYQLSFCTITQAVPYTPVAVGVCDTPAACNAFYPAYTTYAAALADTLSVGGSVAEPVTLTPQETDGGAWVQYFMPAKPASTGGKVCIPNLGSHATTVANFPNANVVDSTVDATCNSAIVASIAGSQGAATGAACTGTHASLVDATCVCDLGWMATSGQLPDGNGDYVTLTGSCTYQTPGRRLLAVKKPFSHAFRPQVQASVFSMSIPTNRTRPALSTVKDLTTIIMPKTFVLESPPPMGGSQGATASPPSPFPPPSPSPPPPSPPMPPGTPVVNLNANDEQMLKDTLSLERDTNSKVKDVHGSQYMYLILAASIGSGLFALTLIGCIVYYCMSMRTKEKVEQQQQDAAGQGAYQPLAEPNKAGLRTFGAGPARMQWRAF